MVLPANDCVPTVWPWGVHPFGWLLTQEGRHLFALAKGTVGVAGLRAPNPR